jgi:hypothetical protein
MAVAEARGGEGGARRQGHRRLTGRRINRGQWRQSPVSRLGFRFIESGGRGLKPEEDTTRGGGHTLPIWHDRSFFLSIHRILAQILSLMYF